MRRKITLNKSKCKYINGRLSIPIELLDGMGVSETEREVTLKLEGNKLIIEKISSNSEPIDKNWEGVTQEERDYLLQEFGYIL